MLSKLVYLGAVALLLHPARGDGNPQPNTVTPPVREVVDSNAGPWGQLEYYRMPLECPREHLDFLSIPSRHVEWTIHADTEDELRESFLRAGLTPEEIDHIFVNSTILHDSGVYRIFPSDDIVLDLPTAKRVRLYGLLSTFPENTFQRRPLFINTDNLSRWFRGSDLSRHVIHDIAKLAYPAPSGRGYFLSDASLTLRRSITALEDKAIFRGLLRRQGLIVHLRLNERDGVESIGDYWRTESRTKAILPLLESVAANAEGGTLDIVHLLPPMPRQNLNRYPEVTDGASGQFPDWFWTCYNFFRALPRDVYAGSEEANQLLHDEYAPIPQPERFGDLLIFSSGGRAVHGCIYIADDIVFSKNSADMFTPWMLVKIEDVIGYHDVRGDVTLSTFRRRPVGESP